MNRIVKRVINEDTREPEKQPITIELIKKVIKSNLEDGGYDLSDVTSAAIGLNVQVTTAAAAFTLNQLRHISVNQTTLGAGSSVSNQYGVYVDQITNGTSNFGFFGNIPAGTNRWNIYMDGTANNYMAGSLGIGATNLGSVSLFISKTMTGSIDSFHVNVNGVIQSDVTNSATYFRSGVSTAAGAFTLANLYHYTTSQGTIGAGSSVTNQYGFFVNSNLTGATNDFGFYGNLAAATNVWNLYMNGTANNYMAGSLGIGDTSLTGYTLRVSKNITGATSSYGVRQAGIVQSDVTADAIGFRNDSLTAASAFTLTNYWHFWVRQGTLGAGSAITNQFGFHVDSNMIGATNTYAYSGAIPSGTNRWNLYMSGTAANYMAGRLGIGITNAAYDLDVFSSSANVSIVSNTNNNGFSGIVSTFNSAYGNFIHMRSYGNTTASTIFGISTNGMNALWSNNDTIYAIGTIGATAMVFGTNNTERVRVKSTGQMRFVPLASDPSGAQAGDVYYNSTTNALKLYDGTVWRTITVV